MTFYDSLDFTTSYNTARVLLISNREAFRKFALTFIIKQVLLQFTTTLFCQRERTTVERSIFSSSVMLPFVFSGLHTDFDDIIMPTFVL